MAQPEADGGRRRMSGYRVGLDIGGTFTDFVLLHPPTGALWRHKRPTTPRDPAEGALSGLRELLDRRGLGMADLEAVVHGTTLVANAIIERRGARTALLCTRGFRDVLEMGREQRYDIYDLFLQFPEPLVPRRLRVEVAERMSRDGEPLLAPDLAVVERQLAALADRGVEALAICFLHAYKNDAHERAVAALVRERFPALWVSVSSEVAPEIGEFERTATTVANAYVQPLMDRYLRRLESGLQAAGFTGRFFLMQSGGGTAAPETARRFPIRLLESGPAGGALVTAFLGAAAGLKDLLAFDMGGTTAKASLIRDGRPDVAPGTEAARVHRFKRGSGIPIKVPAVDLIEIGAGGGSIARADRLGLLKVGPGSAGADPGPACYGLGGEEPTVTDACLVLGYFDPGYFLGGAMPLHRDAAERALERLGRRLGLTVTEAAWGVYDVVCENMAGAARVHIIEQGRDPRRYPLMAFGGAGPAHAVRVARRLGAGEVIIPPGSGVASALGLLVAPIRFDFGRSWPVVLRHLDVPAAEALFREMEAQARAVLEAAGVPPAEVRLERRAEMRLAGQFHDIEVPVPAGRLGPETRERLAATFAAEYRRRYHAVLPGYEPMVLNWRLRASGPPPAVRLDQAPLPGVPTGAGPGGRGAGPGGSRTGRDAAGAALKGRRPAYFREAGGFVPTPVYDRTRLHPGARVAGPAIVEERESTTVIGPGDALTVDALGNLRIQVGSPA